MANQELATIIADGPDAWNNWRRSNRDAIADLDDANFSRMELVGVDLRGCSLRRAAFDGADLDAARLDDADLTGASFSQATLVEAGLRGARASTANFDNCTARRASFSGADLARATFAEADLRDATFEKAELAGANLRSSLLTGTSFDGADLLGAFLPGVVGVGAGRFFVPRLGADDESGATLAYEGELPSLLRENPRLTLWPARDPEQAQSYLDAAYVSGSRAMERPLDQESRPMPRVAAPQVEGIVYPVWFGTNREPLGRLMTTTRRGYSSKRGKSLRFGRCDVFVPASHQIGELGSSFLKRFLSRKDDRLAIKQIHELLEEQFLAEVSKAAAAVAPPINAVIFVHGYNVSFADAAKRAAQIGIDLQIPLMGLYSWPSAGRLPSYASDVAAIEASEEYMSEFLEKFASVANTDRVHIIAHSMGNRGLLRVVREATLRARKGSPLKFCHLVLAAPDIDQQLFIKLSTGYQALCQRATLYVSGKDKALSVSGGIHSYPRAGFVPPVTVVNGIDTVDVKNADLTKMGHSYVATTRKVLNDMFELIVHDLVPDRRFGLTAALTPGGQKYWKIKD